MKIRRYVSTKTGRGMQLACRVVALVALWGCAGVRQPSSGPGGLEGKMTQLVGELVAQMQAYPGMRMAVMPFTDPQRKPSPVGGFLAEQITRGLHRTGRFQIVERKELEKIIEEHKLELTGLVDPSSSAQMGRLLGVQGELMGTATDLGEDVHLSVRLIEVETGLLLATGDVSLRKDRAMRTLLTRRRLRLSMKVVGERRTERGVEGVPVEDGTVLKSGDRFKVYFKTDQSCYAYVFIYDSQGRIQALFPRRETDRWNTVWGGMQYAVPPEDLWFELDDHPGTETLYVVASYEPIHGLGDLLSGVADARLEREIAGAYAQGEEEHMFSLRPASGEIQSVRLLGLGRGIKGVTKGESITYTLEDGTQMREMADVIERDTFVARVVSFQHR